MSQYKINQVAIAMVKANGLINLSRRDLCERAGIPEAAFKSIMGVSFTEFVTALAAAKLEPLTLHAAAKTRTNPALRKEHILAAAVDVARSAGYHKITRETVAEAAGVSPGLVSHYFSTMTGLRRDLMRHAVKQGILEIIAQGLAMRDDHARKASPELKQRATALLAV